MKHMLPLLAVSMLLPATVLAAEKETAVVDPPRVDTPDLTQPPAPPPRSAGEVIDDAKDATNAAIEAAKQAILAAIDKAKENTSAKLDDGKKASEEALDQAHDATKLLDKAAEAAREVLDKAKQATSEVFDKAKDAAAELSKGSAKSTEASPAPNGTTPNERGPRDMHEPQPDPQKWH
jgi:Skp family chaperone for outer membrane proteins